MDFSETSKLVDNLCIRCKAYMPPSYLFCTACGLKRVGKNKKAPKEVNHYKQNHSQARKNCNVKAKKKLTLDLPHQILSSLESTLKEPLVNEEVKNSRTAQLMQTHILELKNALNIEASIEYKKKVSNGLILNPISPPTLSTEKAIKTNAIPNLKVRIKPRSPYLNEVESITTHYTAYMDRLQQLKGLRSAVIEPPSLSSQYHERRQQKGKDINTSQHNQDSSIDRDATSLSWNDIHVNKDSKEGSAFIWGPVFNPPSSDINNVTNFMQNKDVNVLNDDCNSTIYGNIIHIDNDSHINSSNVVEVDDSDGININTTSFTENSSSSTTSGVVMFWGDILQGAAPASYCLEDTSAVSTPTSGQRGGGGGSRSSHNSFRRSNSNLRNSSAPTGTKKLHDDVDLFVEDGDDDDDDTLSEDLAVATLHEPETAASIAFAAAAVDLSSWMEHMNAVNADEKDGILMQDDDMLEKIQSILTERDECNLDQQNRRDLINEYNTHNSIQLYKDKMRVMSASLTFAGERLLRNTTSNNHDVLNTTENLTSSNKNIGIGDDNIDLVIDNTSDSIDNNNESDSNSIDNKSSNVSYDDIKAVVETDGDQIRSTAMITTAAALKSAMEAIVSKDNKCRDINNNNSSRNNNMNNNVILNSNDKDTCNQVRFSDNIQYNNNSNTIDNSHASSGDTSCLDIDNNPNDQLENLFQNIVNTTSLATTVENKTNDEADAGTVAEKSTQQSSSTNDSSGDSNISKNERIDRLVTMMLDMEMQEDIELQNRYEQMMIDDNQISMQLQRLTPSVTKRNYLNNNTNNNESNLTNSNQAIIIGGVVRESEQEEDMHVFLSEYSSLEFSQYTGYGLSPRTVNRLAAHYNAWRHERRAVVIRKQQEGSDVSSLQKWLASTSSLDTTAVRKSSIRMLELENIEDGQEEDGDDDESSDDDSDGDQQQQEEEREENSSISGGGGDDDYHNNKKKRKKKHDKQDHIGNNNNSVVLIRSYYRMSCAKMLALLPELEINLIASDMIEKGCDPDYRIHCRTKAQLARKILKAARIKVEKKVMTEYQRFLAGCAERRSKSAMDLSEAMQSASLLEQSYRERYNEATAAVAATMPIVTGINNHNHGINSSSNNSNSSSKHIQAIRLSAEMDISQQGLIVKALQSEEARIMMNIRQEQFVMSEIFTMWQRRHSKTYQRLFTAYHRLINYLDMCKEAKINDQST